MSRAAYRGPLMATPAGHRGLTRRQAEHKALRPDKESKTYQASLRCSIQASDLCEASSRKAALERYAAELGFTIELGALGVGEA